MALIPTPSVVTIGQTVTVTPAAEQPTKTYKVDFDTGRVAGYVDETEAMKQAIFKILSTERFLYLIYSWNYGIELNAVVGKSYPVFSSEIKRVITGSTSGGQPDHRRHRLPGRAERQADRPRQLHGGNDLRGNPR